MGRISFRFRRNKTDSGNSPKQTKKKKTERLVHFTDIATQRHEYEFDWELETDYWFTRDNLKSMSTARFDDANILRKARGIKAATRNDADELSSSTRDIFIGDKITNALDDVDDNHEISVRGIEHFVFPVLQKEMIRRKKELKKSVLGYSRDPKARKLDPQGIKLAQVSAAQSKWARDVATERGIKYCEMKRGVGGGGGLLRASKTKKMSKAKRRFSISKADLNLEGSKRWLSISKRNFNAEKE